MDGSRLVRALNAKTERGRAYWLQLELNALHEQFSQTYEDMLKLREENGGLLAENEKLKKRLAELKQKTGLVRMAPSRSCHRHRLS